MMALLTGIRLQITHYSFDLHFSNNKQCQTSFHLFFCHLYVFGEIPIQIFCPFFFLTGLLSFFFFFWILSFMSLLYILEINPLTVASFANIFFHTVGCLFVLFMVSFAIQQLLSLIRFPPPFFFLLQWHVQHMEFPRLGVESELQPLAYTTAMPHLSHVCNLHIAHGNVRSMTH